jgi:membrane dipeptidase
MWSSSRVATWRTDGSVIADLHCHYPMHLLERVEPTSTYERVMSTNRPQWLERLRARIFRWAARHFNHPGGDWRVSFDGLEQGRCRLVLSVLYDPVAEIDLDETAGPNPDRDYFLELEDQLVAVNHDLSKDGRGARNVIVRSLAELDGAGDRIAIVHCVEGGFHLGRAEGAISMDEKVRRLAQHGVAYITLAHLFYRGVATNANALPMVPDRIYNAVHCQGPALSEKGREIVTAMQRHHVLVDLSHMRGDAFKATLELLDELDPAGETPVIASHSGFRCGKQKYMLDESQVTRVAARNGVIGLLLARHQLQDGLCDGESLDHTVEIVSTHAAKIREITGSDQFVGIGSDLDGFIEPTMAGVGRAEDLARFADLFRERYDGDADAILFGNTWRVIRRAFELRAG